MNKLSKEKRDRFILTCIVILGILGVLYTFVLGAQKDELATLQTRITGLQDKLSKAERLQRNAATIESSLTQSLEVLEAKQQDMAPQGQYYYWFLKLLDGFRKQEGLDTNFIIDITQPEFGGAGLLPGFPYQTATFGVRLSGDFQDAGRFIAALENEFPYFRVQNVRMSPQSAGLLILPPGQQPVSEPGDERLIVELKVVTLIKPGTT